MTQPPQYGGPPPPPYGYAPSPPPTVFPGGYASWGSRVVATLWDVVFLWPAVLLGILAIAAMVGGLVLESEPTGDGVALLVVGGLLMVLAWMVAVALGIWNQVFRQGRTGQSWGKSRLGIIVLRESDGRPQGPAMSFVRWLLHAAINQAFYIDYLWPLWDDRNQTLTDKILDTVVVNLPQGAAAP